MSDILKVSAPLVDKNNIPSQKPASDPTIPFKLGEIPVVAKASSGGELLKQGNTLINKEMGSAILTGMLKDPAVTVRYLTSVFMLEEIVGLLPLNNSAQTGDMEKLLTSLMLKPEEITGELLKQEQSATDFKGMLFDFLRDLIVKAEKTAAKPAAGNRENAVRGEAPTVKDSPFMEKNLFGEDINVVSGFLKALNGMLTREQARQSVSNNLLVLAKLMAPAKELSSALEALSKAFLKSEGGNFEALSQKAIVLTQEIEKTILHTPQTEKLISITNYNLSRFQSNSEYFSSAFKNVLNALTEPKEKLYFAKSTVIFLLSKLSDLPPTEREYVLKSLSELLPGGVKQLQQIFSDDTEALQLYAKDSPKDRVIRDENLRDALISLSENKDVKENVKTSKVMNTISEILKDDGETLKALNPEKINKILVSLLSSPSNFTPLLHFIIPVKQNNLNSFGEFWINPQDSDESGEKPKKGIHMLINFEISDLGRFEAELWCENKRLSFSLFCPPETAENYKAIKEPVKKAAASLGYSFDSINVDTLVKPRNLMDVFKSLPQKRSGINVKV